MTGTVDLRIEDSRWQAFDPGVLAEGAARATLTHLGLMAGEFTVAILAGNDARTAELNAAFRGREGPTNVLSWPSAERRASRPGALPRPPEEAELGDIALAFETCAAEAQAAGRPLADHVTHLVVHGLLHLLGHDHENEPDAALMESAEVAILAELGLPDPYS